jgi:hypothetical protein
MPPAPGIVTSGTGPPNAVVEIQPGMNVQPVVLVDQNGQYVTTSGSTATAGYLADLTGSVAVFAAPAPIVGQVLTATSGSTATWQSGSTETAGYLATTGASVFVAGGAAPSTGMELVATSGTAATWQFGASGILTTLGDMLFENSTPALARLAGNTTATKMFLTQTGSGTVSANPAWGTIASTDIPPNVALTGSPTATTATTSDNTTRIATDAFVQSAIAAVGVPNQSGYATWTFNWDLVGVVDALFNYPGMASGDLVLTRFLYLPVASTLGGSVDLYWHTGGGGNAETYVGVYALVGGNAVLQGSASPDLSAQATGWVTLSTGQTSWPAGWYALGYAAGTQASSGAASAPFIAAGGAEQAGAYLPGDTFAPIPAVAYYANSYTSLPGTVALSHFTTKSYVLMNAALR